MRRFGLVMGVAAMVIAGTTIAHAQDAAEPAAGKPEPTIQPLALEFTESGFSGPGAETLRAEIADAQFIAIGEDHGFADAPDLIAAFASEGRATGFTNYAVEVGPWSTDWLREQLLSGGVEALARSLTGRPLALPFLGQRREANVALGFLDDGQLWGIDQEFIGSTQIHLDWFAERTEDGEASETIRDWASVDREAFASGNQQSVFMVTAGPEEWSYLRKIFADDAEALERVDALQTSQSIYLANFEGRGFDNNTARVALIREYFLKHYAEAKQRIGQPPRVLMKMGAVHVGAGTSPMKTFDIGSLIEGIAAENGMDVVRIAYLPVGGSQLGIRPSPDGIYAIQEVRDGEKLISDLAEAGIDMEVVTQGQSHFVIPLEPARRNLGNAGLNDADDMFRFVMLGFDYLVTTNNAQAATPLAER
ncbi:MAG: hypothetical protein QNI87_05685 [Erythrobacter sp.]|uniref:hypothetical protein n=1 Tax=Erythrobacter sp. TaxID=1042 RepID=UPI002609C1E2|nr:hypothetical protein [Erythrobacter sp.]MDJ0978009.1 hypothetical protein [Erythrobacter sp.]